MTVQENVLTALVTALDGAGKPTGLIVHREPAVPLEEDAEKALVFYPLLGSNESGTITGETLRSLEFVTEVRRRLSTSERASGLTVSEALDELYAWTVEALEADVTLGGLTLDITEGAMDWDQEVQNRLHGRAAVRWTVRFFVRRDDAETGAP